MSTQEEDSTETVEVTEETENTESTEFETVEEEAAKNAEDRTKLEANWGDTEAFKNPLRVTSEHPNWEEFKNTVDEAENSPWDEDEDGSYFMRQPLIEVLASLTIFIKLNEINEDNVDEWAFRLAILRFFDPEKVRTFEFVDEGWVSMPITRAHLDSCIGLTTNYIEQDRDTWMLNFMKSLALQVQPIQ